MIDTYYRLIHKTWTNCRIAPVLPRTKYVGSFGVVDVPWPLISTSPRPCLIPQTQYEVYGGWICVVDPTRPHHGLLLLGSLCVLGRLVLSPNITSNHRIITNLALNLRNNHYNYIYINDQGLSQRILIPCVALFGCISFSLNSWTFIIPVL